MRVRAIGRTLAALAASVAITGGIMAATQATPAAAGVLPTTTTVTASKAIIDQGNPVTLTATVGPLDLVVTPTGTVTFKAGKTVLGTSPLNGGCIILLKQCQATLTTTGMPFGANTVVARYSGDTLSQPSQGSTMVTVQQTTNCGISSCSASATSPDGSTNLDVDSQDNGTPNAISISFGGPKMTCSAGVGQIADYKVTPGHETMITLTYFGKAADAANANPTLCGGFPKPWTTKNGAATASGSGYYGDVYEGIIDNCNFSNSSSAPKANAPKADYTWLAATDPCIEFTDFSPQNADHPSDTFSFGVLVPAPQGDPRFG